MKRMTLAAFALGVTLVPVGLLAFGQGGSQVRYGDLKITGISSKGIHAEQMKGPDGSVIGSVFGFAGSPTLVATMRNLTMRAARVEGKVDQKNTLSTATLSGGVHGVIQMVSEYGPEPLTMDCSKLIYSDDGAPAMKFNLSGGVKIFGSNPAPEKMTLTSATGVVRVTKIAGAELGLASADLSQNVVADFVGVLHAGKDKNSSHFHATADHLVVTRGGDSGTDYLIELSGNVVIHGTGNGGELNLQTSHIKVVLDKDRAFKSLDGDDDPAATHGTVRQNG